MNPALVTPEQPSGRQAHTPLLPLFLGALLIALIPRAASAEQTTAPTISATNGQKFHLQFSLFHEAGEHRTTNYRKGILVPVNTEVTFIKVTRRDILVVLPGGERLTLVNVQDFSGETVPGIFKRTFAANKVDLTKFTQAEREAINSGQVREGMSKTAVIVALGYPPKHRTPSLESDAWRYWQNRFNTFTVHFSGGKVRSIKT
jgi:hypothetical protein